MNFTIEFTNPYLLLLLIPALLIVAFTFFRVNKRFRYSVNRIVSIVLCSITIILSVFMVSGMTFEFDKKNKDNEVIVLVDCSDSNEDSKLAKDVFVKDTINNLPKNISLGVVKFGYDQVYAVKMSKDVSSAYDEYTKAKAPNGTATNISRALLYADSLFKHKGSSKIVLLTDGIETDGDAIKTIENLALKDVRVDVVEFPNGKIGNEIQLSDIKLPEKTIITNDVISIELIVNSSVNTDIQVKVLDNREEAQSKYVKINRGENRVLVQHSFSEKGLHDLEFIVESIDDNLSINNRMHSFVNIDEVNRILVLDREMESSEFIPILNENLKVSVKNIKDAPMNVSALREYEQVVLINIANSDMPTGFIEILNSYVKEYGGGLLTIGGLKDGENGLVANTYNREDMKDTLYQDMIPVQAVDYKPPVAVTLVIDISGSMFTPIVGSDRTMMDEAKDSAKAALKSLEPKDYLGVVVFGKTGRVIIEPTPVAQREKIYTAIDSINAVMEPTFYSTGLEKAGIGLKPIDGVNNKHIILISDGAPSASDGEYLDLTTNHYNNGITTSVISYGSRVLALEQIAELGHGGNYVAEVSKESLTEALNKDLSSPVIREFEYKTFKPTVGESSIILKGIKEEDIPTLDGFFGTKLKRGATCMLEGEFGEPIYAEWEYGKGRVGSFMCDLSGVWSKSFIEDPNGRQIVNNILLGLFPNGRINQDDIEININNKNYEINTNIYTKLEDKEKLNFSVKKVGDTKYLMNEEIKNFNKSQTVSIDALLPGIYEIKIEKLDKDGNVVTSTTKYQAISYSKEYDLFENSLSHRKEIEDLVLEGNGNVITAGSEVYKNIPLFTHKEFDPRYVFASLVLILILVDLAVRKFKFKSINEIKKDREQGVNR